jgi:two-component sensor histidine kinase
MALDRALLRASWRSWYANDLRAVGPAWLQWLWTAIFSCAIGLGFFVLGLGFSLMGGRTPSDSAVWRWFVANMGIALTIGFTIHAMFWALQRVIGADRIRRFSNPMRGLFFGGVPLVGTMIGWPLGAWLVGTRSWFPLDRPGTVVASFLIALLLCVIFYFHFDAKARQIAAEKRAAEAQLRLLQGQMEPHFVFNTLATVLGLMDAGDTPRARQMLEAFIDYLRASLGKLRSGDSTLGDELALAETYLSLMQQRMGERLAFDIRLDDEALRRAAMPPLLLQPLVENAIHHGLESKVEGGRVGVHVRRDGARLVIEVADDGLGTAAPAARRTGTQGNGVALANLRERLVSRYGHEAGLALDLRPDAGARATLAMPLEFPPA